MRITIYKGEGCESCIYQSLRTRSKCGIRLLSRFANEELLEKMRIKMESEEGKREYKKRSMTMEPLFGHFKDAVSVPCIRENLKFR